MAKKAARKSDKNTEGGSGDNGPTEPSTKKSVPKSTNSSSNFSLWVMLFLISVGYGVGFYYFLEQVKRDNNALVGELNSLKSQIGALSNMQSQLPGMAEAIQSIPEIKETFNVLKSEMSDAMKMAASSNKASFLEMEKSFQHGHDGLQNQIKDLANKAPDTEQLVLEIDQKTAESTKASFAEVETSLKTLEEGHMETKKQFEDLKSKMPSFNQLSTQMDEKLAATLEASLSPFQDEIAVAKTNIEGIANEIVRMSSSTEEQSNKLKDFQQTISEVQLASKKSDSKLNQFEEASNSRFSNFETNARTYELALSEKIALLEKTTASQLKDMLTHVTESRKQSESVKTSTDELQANMRFVISDSLETIKAETQQHKLAIAEATSITRKLEQQVIKLESSGGANELASLREELQQLYSEMKEAAAARRALEDATQQSTQKLENEISTLTSLLRSFKTDASSLYDDVTALTENVNEMKKSLEAQNAETEKLSMVLASQQPQETVVMEGTP